MAAKPSVDPKWSSDNVATDNIEPTQNLKDGGIISGSVFGREHLNWMFNAFSQWIDWVRSYALDKDNNLSELTNKNTARTNLELNTSATTIGANTTGSAAKLTTARTIGGVSFDGSANINLPGVNQTGNQDTTGSAASLTTPRTINGTNFNGTGNITTASWGFARTLTIGNASKSVNGSGNVTWSLGELGYTWLNAENGWMKLPSGLIIQWGQFTSTNDGDQTFSFPIAFPNVCYVANCAIAQGGQVATTKSEFTVDRLNEVDGNPKFHMIAIGR